MKILRIQCQKSDFVAIEEPDAADREQMTQIRERQGTNDTNKRKSAPL